MADNNYYVYQYITENGQPYYIGKGKNNRIDVDHKHIALPPKDRRIILKNNLTNDKAKLLEIELITKYGRKLDGGILDNIKINQWACRAGWKHSSETIEKISRGNAGKVRSEEHKQKYRNPKTDSHASNIQNAVKNLWADPVYKQKRLEKTMETRRKNGFSE